MNQISPLTVCLASCLSIALCVLPVPPHAVVRANETSDSSDTDHSGEGQRRSGGAILLSDHQVIQGHAQQAGDRIKITQTDGAVIYLPSQRVLCWGPDLNALYQFRVDRRGKPDLLDHLTDARWCLNNGLRPQAAREIVAALRMSPTNSEAKRLEELLRNEPTPSHASSEVSQAERESDADPLKIPPESMEHFSRQVQPILLNRCGVCHDTNRNRQLTLLRVPGAARVSAAMTQHNLQQVAKWIDHTNPSESPLLKYAQQAHGGSTTVPLGKPQAQAFDSLSLWVHRFAASASPNNISADTRPSIFGPGSMAGPAFASKANSPANSPAENHGLTSESIRQATAAVVQANHLEAAPAGPGIAGPSAENPRIAQRPAQLKIDPQKADPIRNSLPRRLPPVNDPFDPEIFNSHP